MTKKRETTANMRAVPPPTPLPAPVTPGPRESRPSAAPPPPPAPPAVIIPPPPSAAEIAAAEAETEPSVVPVVEALRELLAAVPRDIATCADMTPAKLTRYLEARRIAEAVLAG